MDLGLDGKVALITGGSEGIGKATAGRMAAEGATVVICARRHQVLERAAQDIEDATGAEVTAIPADVTQPTQLAGLFDRVVAGHGHIDILVNNAGQGANRPFEDLTDEAWQADLDLKLLAAIRCCRMAVPHMRARGGGRIINVTNVDAKAPGPGSLPASVSRAGGVALTKALSQGLRSRQHPRQHRLRRLYSKRAERQAGRAADRRQPGPDTGRLVRGDRKGGASVQGRAGGGGRRRHHVPCLSPRQLYNRRGNKHRRWPLRGGLVVQHH